MVGEKGLNKGFKEEVGKEVNIIGIPGSESNRCLLGQSRKGGWSLYNGERDKERERERKRGRLV